MKSSPRLLLRIVCKHCSREDDLLLTLSIFVVCFVLFAR